MGMNDQNEPPKRHVRMKRGRPRKEPMPELVQTPEEIEQHKKDDNYLANQEALRLSLPKIYPNPEINSVIQVIKGEHTGRLAIVGRIDPDCYKCYVVLFGGTRDYLDVRADEFALIGKAKKAFKDAIPEHPLPSGTPNINSDTTPFGGFK